VWPVEWCGRRGDKGERGASIKIQLWIFSVMISGGYKVFLTFGPVNNTKSHALLNTEQIESA
jgi:hypothetical protein